MPRTLSLPAACCLLLLAACSPIPSPGSAPAAPQLVYLQLDPDGAARLVARRDLFSSPIPLPYQLPEGCAAYRLYPNPVEPLLAVELLCGDEPVVQLTGIDPSADPVDSSSSPGARFLAWSADGRYHYLSSGFVGDPHIVRIDRRSGRTETLPFPANIYDMAGLPDGRIVYSLTRGLGFGSETWLADAAGGGARQILARPQEIAAYLRPSPDGSRIAFIAIPDSQTPFTVGELWVMNSDGGQARSLAAADAGHGFAPAWSPDGEEIAFVVRENPDDPQADTSAAALLSNVYRIRVQGGTPVLVTAFPDAAVETPAWSPDGTGLVFNVVKDATIQVWYDDSGTLRPLGSEPSCCAIWVPGR